MFLSPSPLLPQLLNVIFYLLSSEYIGENTGPSAILSIIHIVTIGTMLNLDNDNNGHGLKKRSV